MNATDRDSHSAIATARSAGATHIGYQRSRNEDALWGDEARSIWVVADGLGGHRAGSLASQTVVAEIQRAATTDGHYERALQRAHSLLLSEVNNPLTMGSTAVVASEEGPRFHIYWVGDSRAYLWTPGPANGELRQLTSDHSYVQALLDSGTINSSEAASHPQRHIITRCIGGSTKPGLTVDRLTCSWRAGQRLLLCSDGLSNAVEAARICQILSHNADNLRAADLLIEAALNAGGKDNISVVLIHSPTDASTATRAPAVAAEPTSKAAIRGGKLTTLLLLCTLGAAAIWQLSQYV